MLPKEGAEAILPASTKSGFVGIARSTHMAKAQAVAAARKKTAANPAGAPATPAEAEAAKEVAEAIAEANGKKLETPAKAAPAQAQAQAPTVKAEKPPEEPEKATEEEPVKQAAAPTQTTTPTAEIVRLYVRRGPGAPGWAEEYVGLGDKGTAEKFAHDLAFMAGDISLAERVVRVDMNKNGFCIVHTDEETAKKLLAITQEEKKKARFVSNNKSTAVISLYNPPNPAFRPATSKEEHMSAKLMDGAKGAEKLQEARKTAPQAQAAIQVSGGNGSDPRKGRPVPKTTNEGEKPREIDFDHITWFEKLKCVVALLGIPAALAHLRASIERTASGTSEWAAANKLLFTWGKTLVVEPQMMFVNTDGTVRFELLTDSIQRFFELIMRSEEPRRIECLLADVKACSGSNQRGLRPDQIAMLTEMVSTEIAKLNEAEKQAALEAAKKAGDEAEAAKAKAKAATTEMEAMKAEIAQLRAAAAAKSEPTAEQVAEKAAEEISPASTTPAVQ